jgi:hypothetical protein
MDSAVALVRGYLHVNRYFTVCEHPIVEALRRGGHPWDVLRHVHLKDPALGHLALVERIRRARPGPRGAAGTVEGRLT